MSDTNVSTPATPIFDESIGDALIDAARINVMAAQAFPDFGPSVLLPGDEELPPTIADCLEQAMQWLDAARAGTLALPEAQPPTSVHVVGNAKRAAVELIKP